MTMACPTGQGHGKKYIKKVSGKSWESHGKVVQMSWECYEKILRKSRVSIEKIMRKS